MTASPAQYVDPANRFRFTIPAVCRARPPVADGSAYFVCGNGYVRVTFTAGPTSRAALQPIADSILHDWQGLKMLENHTAPPLDGRPARIIFVEGIGPTGTIGDLQMLAVAKDGGWYVLVLALPALEWRTNAAAYFDPIKRSFRFRRP